MEIETIREEIVRVLFKDAEYFSGGIAWIISFVTLNIHLSGFANVIIVRCISGIIGLVFTAAAVVLTHYLKTHLERKKVK